MNSGPIRAGLWVTCHGLVKGIRLFGSSETKLSMHRLRLLLEGHLNTVGVDLHARVRLGNGRVHHRLNRTRYHRISGLVDDYLHGKVPASCLWLKAKGVYEFVV